jgi:enoyl-CoA hydratase
MPEAKIGFFTDVSGGWVLGRMRNNLGKWLGLTGEVLKGESIVKAGLAKFFVWKKDLGELELELQSVFESFGEQKG